MKSKIAIVSLRFNPAFIQFLIAYAKTAVELGCEVEFILDSGYRRFEELASIANIAAASDIGTEPRWTHALFLNPSVKNLELAAKFKKIGAKILYIYHEPWQMSPGYLFDEGLVATAKAFAAHRFTVPVLRLANVIILPSRFGISQYRKADAKHNRSCVYIPLLFDDEAPENSLEDLSKKQFFGYVGGLCRAHGFDQYIAFMKYAFRKGMDTRFMIGSMYPLPGGILDDPLIKRNLDKLEIRCGRPLTSEEMNACYAESFCIWNIYRRSTQSAVLPKAMMLGTPSLASRAGSYPEFITDGFNGKFAVGDDVDSIARAVDNIRANQASYASACRERFRNIFFYGSQLHNFAAVL